MRELFALARRARTARPIRCSITSASAASNGSFCRGCANDGMPVMAYSPLGQGALLRNRKLATHRRGASARRRRKLALAWLLRTADVIAIPAIVQRRSRPREPRGRRSSRSMRATLARDRRRVSAAQPRDAARRRVSAAEVCGRCDALRLPLSCTRRSPRRAAARKCASKQQDDSRPPTADGAWHGCCYMPGETPRETAEQTPRETAVNYTYYDYLDLAPGASPARIEAAYAAAARALRLRRRPTPART